MRRALLGGSLAACLGLAVPGCARVTPADNVPGRLGVDGRTNAHVTLAAVGDRVAAVWVASADARSDVFAAMSEDGGRHFDEPVRVNSIGGDAAGNGEQPPRVVLDGRKVTVVWVSKRDGVSGIRAAQSGDGGRTFSPSRTISPEPVTGARGWESAAIAEDGTVHVAWLDGRHAAPHVHGAAQAPGAMRQDIVHAMWRGDDPVVETPVAADVCFCCKTGVAVRGNDVFVVWRHLFPGGVRDIAVARSSDGGRTFAAPSRVSADNWKIDACPDDGPSLALGPDGRLRVAWPTLLQDAAPHMAIFEAESRDGGATFSPRARVDGSPSGASHPRLAMRERTRAVVWDEAANEGRHVMIRVGEAAPSMLGAGTYPAIVAAGDGFVTAWTERGGALRLSRVAAAGF